MSTGKDTRAAGRAGAEYQALLARDSRPVPQVLASQSPEDLGTEPLSAARYTSQAFFDLECERMWPRVWQVACREEDIPEPGDFHVYDVVGRSLLVVRLADGGIRAYHNSCLHRGRRLATADGHAQNFRCGFHGWTWNLDGSIRSVPCRWDFPQLSDDDLRLPQAQVGTWGGFVFVNMDPGAAPLEQYLGVLPLHFERWRLEDCYKAVHVAKVIRCNWKVAMEAFMESYHVIATHPQILPVFADASAQYDVYGEHVNRNLAAFGAPSPHLGEDAVAPGEVVEGMLAMMGRRRPAGGQPEGEAGARAYLGDLNRASFAKAFGGDYEDVSDAETIDALVYNVFPNFAPWAGFAPNIVYRWRPNGRDVGSCLMEVMILKRCPTGQPRPRPVRMRLLSEAEPWSAATELPVLGPVIDQDMGNMPHVQDGLDASATGRVHLSRYQEVRIRHFHRTLDHYLG
ncbi:MAG: aromatic ring-hydroxylating dioxygenase subunit alpha [Steroidobacteraceae bacterium]|jgi:phenylpropionate dioxygenase-like ring-hydroxylating dioxygenase large terminal subunit|nr:aromatic ring-hydroxylating dioxygenase subunit alpha [Steroidobacteraceae bacterium]